MKKLLLALGLVLLGLTGLAQGTINGKNSAVVSPLLDSNGLKLPVTAGRVQVLYGDVVLNSDDTLAIPGVFSTGVLTVPGVAAGGTAKITVRAWDVRAGITFAAAQAAGFGFGSSSFDVVGLGGALTPPPGLDNFKGLTLAGAPVFVSGAVNLKNSGANSPLLAADGSKLSVATGRFEVYFGDTLLSTVRNTLAAPGVFSAGVVAVPGVPPGGTASLTVRAWDTSAGATYAAARAAGKGFGSATFDVVGLGGDLVLPPNLDNFNGIRLGSTVANTPPVAAAQNIVVEEDKTVSFKLAGTDIDGDRLVYSVVTPPKNGALRNGFLGSEFSDRSYKPSANFNGTDSFTFKVNDGKSDSAVVRVSITVTPVNDAPTATARTVATTFETAANITLGGADVDGDALTFSVVAQPKNGTLSGTDTARVYTPNKGFSGADSFTYKANDGKLDSAAVTVGITVKVPNRAPVATAQKVSFQEAKPIAINFQDATSAGFAGYLADKGLPYGDRGNGLSYGWNKDNSGNARNRNQTDKALAPDERYDTFNHLQKPDGPWFWEIALSNGTYLVHIVAGEPNNFDSTMRIKAEDVLVVNGAPNTTAERFREGTTLVTVADGRLTVAPSEADGAVNAKIAFMEITAVNKVTLAGTDPDGDALTFTVVSGPKNGAVVGTGKDQAYVPTVGFKGADSFTFKVGDGKLESAVATVDIDVTRFNRVPVAVAMTNTTAFNKPFSFKLVATDADNDTLTFTNVTRPRAGTLRGTTTADRSYTPNTGFSGTDTFNYRVFDGFGYSAVVKVTIIVKPRVTTTSEGLLSLSSDDASVKFLKDFLSTDGVVFNLNSGILNLGGGNVFVVAPAAVASWSDGVRLSVQWVQASAEAQNAGARKAVAPVAARLVPRLLVEAPAGSVGSVEWSGQLGESAQWQPLSPVTVGESGKVGIDLDDVQATGYFRFIAQ